MFYRDLVQFTPIETIVQLRDSEKEAAAKSLVETYVISDAMANKLVDLVIPQLQFDRPHDNKGILIVGNYGTGKSHLMSVISAVAQRSELKDFLTNTKVKQASSEIAGKFKVVRVEIGAVTRGLREILLDELQASLLSWDVNVDFPTANQVNNNKDLIIQAVAAFQEKYPGLGIMLIVDELLDYLRSRDPRAVILDLGFLRELGEVAASCPFRFIGGLQETLFETPHFDFVKEQLRRVRDRFEQINIAREDIAFVVSERLLKKTDTQKAQITNHLRQFEPLYKSMAERMDEFVNLFPIHPVYIDTFEDLAIAEKRQVLKTFSNAIRTVFDMEVPNEQPGLISYDQYWKLIKEDPALRADENIANVIDKSGILEGLIRNAYTRPILKDLALRIIHALSVQRLTTSSINTPVGVTPENLRDGLCLYLNLPTENNNADFLLDQVRVALREITRTVQGQFLSHNTENDQYYIDVTRSVDFDQKIHERGEFMDKSDLNIAFYDALRQALNLSDTTYLTSYSIWFYELHWIDHKVTRPGYLFFGPPDERTTAQPPRDFYLYFLPPFMNREWRNEKLADEVIFYLAGLDDDFELIVRQYAGARAMANESAEYRLEYADKRETHLRMLSQWLQTHMIEKLHIVYQGVDEPIQSALTRMRTTASHNLEELIQLVASQLIAPEFEDRYPDYPKFRRLSTPVSENSRGNSAMEAIRSLCGTNTNLGSGVLDGLGILNEQGKINPNTSPYAEHFKELLAEKEEGQVINRGEVIELISDGLQKVEKDLRFKLEPEWVVVILLSLVYSGDIVLNLDGRQELDAGTLDLARTRPMADLTHFRFFKRPTALPIGLWSSIFEGLGLPPGLIRDENTRENAVIALQSFVRSEFGELAPLQTELEQSAKLWNTSIFTDLLPYQVEGGFVTLIEAPEVLFSITELLPSLRGYKKFLDSLNVFTTVGKLHNLRMSASEITESLEYRQIFKRTKQLRSYISQLQPITAYLAEAQANLPSEHPWTEKSRQAQKHTLDAIRRFGKGEAAFDLPSVQRELSDLKKEYIEAYSHLHRKARLSADADTKRQRLYKDTRFETLKSLSGIDLLSRGNEFNFWKERLLGLVACREFHEGVIADSPTCPYCHLRPSQSNETNSADVQLTHIDGKLSEVLRNWRKALRDNLSSETAQHSLEAMSPTERKPVDEFLKQHDDTEGLPTNFVQSAIQALRGIQAVTLAVDSLILALKTGGLPCTREELQKRFTQFLDQQARGYDFSNTRLTLDQ